MEELTFIMIRKAKISDIDNIYSLYKSTATIPGGLARNVEEITREYISNFVTNSITRGLSLVVEMNKEIIGELHAYRPNIKVFNHVLSELTICIHPDHQGLKYGKSLFTEFMNIIQNKMNNIKRVELIARESNTKAIKFYQSLDFEIEGCLRNRIEGILNRLENDIPMGWIRSS